MSLTHLPSQQQARQTTSEQSQSSCNKVLTWALFMEQNLRFGLVWAGLVRVWPVLTFGPDWYFENYESLVFLNLISSRYLVQINKRVMLLTFSYVSWTFNFLICLSVNGGWAGWVIAHPDFGRIEGTAGQFRRAALLLPTHIQIAIDAPELCITTLPKCVWCVLHYIKSSPRDFVTRTLSRAYLWRGRHRKRLDPFIQWSWRESLFPDTTNKCG